MAGEESALGVARAHRLTDIRSGTSNTILLLESDSGIPWTKPEDLPFTPKPANTFHLDLPKPFIEGELKTAFCDATVKTLNLKLLTEKALLGLLTKEHDLFEWKKFLIESDPPSNGPGIFNRAKDLPMELEEFPERDTETYLPAPGSFSQHRDPSNNADPKTGNRISKHPVGNANSTGNHLPSTLTSAKTAF